MKQHFLGKLYKEKLIQRLGNPDLELNETFSRVPFNIEVYKIIRLKAVRPFISRLGLCTLIIPRGTKVYRTIDKCRAAEAYVKKINVLEFVPRPGQFEISDLLETEGYSDFDPNFKYKMGKKIIPDCFEKKNYRCGGGIHFFLTQKQAIEYTNWI